MNVVLAVAFGVTLWLQYRRRPHPVAVVPRGRRGARRAARDRLTLTQEEDA